MIHGANMGPIWGRQDPGGFYVGPMSFAIWESLGMQFCSEQHASEMFVECMVYRIPKAFSESLA